MLFLYGRKKYKEKTNKNLFKAHYAFCLTREKVGETLCNLKRSIGRGYYYQVGFGSPVCHKGRKRVDKHAGNRVGVGSDS